MHACGPVRLAMYHRIVQFHSEDGWLNRRAGLYRARAGHPLEPGHEAGQVPGGHHSGEAAPNEPLPGLLGGQLYQLAVTKTQACIAR